MAQADSIRAWIVRSMVAPARATGAKELEIRAGDVHDRIGLRGKVPNVCQVLGGGKLAEEAGLELLEPRPKGPKPSAVFRYRLLPHAGQPGPRSVLGAIQPKGSAVVDGASRQRVPQDGSASDLDHGELARALVLVSCVKSKLRAPAPARDLYVSDGFRKARRLAEQAVAWRILSAKYGLVHPDTWLEPYETSLNSMGVAARRQWAEQALGALLPLARQTGQVIILAGVRYREQLVSALRAAGVRVSVPMEGLRQGEQLAWLGQQVARLDRGR